MRGMHTRGGGGGEREREREFISYVGHAVYAYLRAGQVAERVQFVYRVCGVCIPEGGRGEGEQLYRIRVMRGMHTRGG